MNFCLYFENTSELSVETSCGAHRTPRVEFGLVPLSIEVEVIAILVTICSNDDTEAAPESSRDHDEPVESIVVFLEF